MAILKKTLFAGLAAIILATAGTAVTTTSADAGNYYNKHSNKHYKKNYSYKYKKHSHYKSNCYYKKVWHNNHNGYGYGHGHWSKVKVCY